MEDERIMQVLFDTIDEVNPQLLPEQRLEKSKDTVLFGKSGRLDSLALVTLIVEIEQRMEEELKTTISLADDRAMSQKTSPFQTVQTLADYIASLLGGKTDA
jgi:acyl carrier protein